MKLKILVILALDKIRFQKKSVALIIVLMCMSLMFMGEILLYRSIYAYSENSCQKILAKSIDGTGLIYVNDGMYTSEEANEFLHEAEKSEIISSIGSCADDLRTDKLPALAKMQKELLHEEELGLHWIFMNRAVIGLCDLRFQEEKEIKPEQWGTDNWFGLYLGSNFKNIPIGTCYTATISADQEYVYEVVGILEEGERFVTNSLLSGSSTGGDFHPYRILDSYVICIADVPPPSGYWGYSVEDGYTLEQGEDFLKALAKKYGMSLDFSNLRANFTYDKLKNEQMIDIFSEIFYLTFFVAIIINLCIFLVAFLNNVNEYGIFYAMGISKHELQWILAIENVMKCVFSFFLSWGIFYTWIKGLYVRDTMNLYIINDIMYHDIFPYMLLIVVIYIVLFSVAPFLILNYCKPVTLMKGNRI